MMGGDGNEFRTSDAATERLTNGNNEHISQNNEGLASDMLASGRGISGANELNYGGQFVLNRNSEQNSGGELEVIGGEDDEDAAAPPLPITQIVAALDRSERRETQSRRSKQLAAKRGGGMLESIGDEESNNYAPILTVQQLAAANTKKQLESWKSTTTSLMIPFQ